MTTMTQERREKLKALAQRSDGFTHNGDRAIADFFARAQDEGSTLFGDSFGGGTGSFFHAPTTQALKDIDIACVGLPFETSAPVRPGTRFAANAVREWSGFRGPVHDVWKTIPFELCSVADFGDVPLRSPHDVDATVRQVTEVYTQFRENGIYPLTIGGVHTMTHPILRGLTGGEPVCLVHIDAHADTARGDFQGSELNDCSVFLNAALDGAIDPERTIQIGIRNGLSAFWDFSHESGMRVIPMHEFFEIGVAGVLKEIRERIGDRPFYLSIDTDGLDSTYLPGTQLPEPFGLTSRELLLIIRGLKDMNIIGADIAELCPPYDPHGISANLCSAFAFEILCLLSESHARNFSKARKTHWKG
ncbi:arginase family protein [Pseudomonas sp. UFMG81]|uniref:arginase family protein n=1 Tax=Pseudomonas sp. UFMG81 TaxID=2745936 RepID=UPI00188FA9FD|nr:arginase family protein [Pseudomonas sp. UFMG81]